MQHYTTLKTLKQGGFDIIVDKTWEDIDPWSQLSECFDSKEELYADIESCKYDWFMLRVRVLLDGHKMAVAYVGGCLYENAEDVLTDGTAEDLIGQAMEDAEEEVLLLRNKLDQMLVDIQCREAV